MKTWFCLAVFACTGCTSDQVNLDESLGKYFKENKSQGCFALFNNSSGLFTIYNMERYRDTAFLPASTFKIVNALVGLQTGDIVNDSMLIPWDGVTRQVAAWNEDLSMYRAFRVSSVPYFQEIARRIGKDTLQQWLDSLSYGTMTIRGPVDSFWLDNSLKVKPDEQLGLVKKLYFNQLPFHKINQETVKNAMLFEDTPEYRLSYKTGLGISEKGSQIAWVVGYIEESTHPSFFVLNMETSDTSVNLVTARMQVLKQILADLGFMKGMQ